MTGNTADEGAAASWAALDGPRDADDADAAAPARRRLPGLHVLFPLVALLFVGAFVGTVPAGFGLDEANHALRAWQVSRGVPEPETITPGLQYGGPVPAALVDYVLEGTDASNAGRGTGQPWTRQDVGLAPDLDELGRAVVSEDSPSVLRDFTNTGASSFVPYLPAAAGMRVASLLDADVAGVVLAAKAASGLSYVVLASLAVLVLRRSRWRWLVALVALLPTTVFQAGVLTADTFSNGIALLFVASVLALHERAGRAPAVLLVGTLAAALGLVAAKPTYVLLVPLLLLVPTAALGLRNRLAAWGLRLGATAVVGVVAVVLTARASDVADAIRTQIADWPLVDRHVQLAQLLGDPPRIVGVLARTFVEFGSTWVEGVTAQMGTNSVFLPEPFVVLLIVALVLAALRGGRRSRVLGWALVLLSLATVCAVVMALYLTFTVVGAPSAVGVQGRYFTPVLVPLLAGIGMVLPARVEMGDRTAAVAFSAVSVGSLAVALAVWCLVVY